jgi:hypothetical protein
MTDTTPCAACGRRPAVWDSDLCEPCADEAIRLELSCDWLPDEEPADGR